MTDRPKITRAEFAEWLANVDDIELAHATGVIDTADFGSNPGHVRFEGYLLNSDGDKFYLEANVRVEGVSVDSLPYKWADEHDAYEDE